VFSFHWGELFQKSPPKPPNGRRTAGAIDARLQEIKKSARRLEKIAEQAKSEAATARKLVDDDLTASKR